MNDLSGYLFELWLNDEWNGDDQGSSDLDLSEGMVQPSTWGVECAWCLAEQERTSGLSHGICQFHHDQVLQARRSGRR